MGAAYSDTCYSTDLEAAGAFCASSFPRVTTDPQGAPIMQTCTVQSATAVAISSAFASAPTSSTTMAVSFPVCDPLERYTDLGVLWAVGIGLCCLIAVTKGTFSFLWRDW